mgnify:CR=1 FL=1
MERARLRASAFGTTCWGGTTRQQRARPADLISTNNRALELTPPMLAALTRYLRAISAVAAGGGSFSVSVAIAQFLMPVVGSQQSMV